MDTIKLKTKRLIILPISLSDVENIHELHSLPETDQFNTLGIPENIEETKAIVKEWIQKNQNGSSQNFVFKIALAESNEFIGLIALNLGKPKHKIAEIWFKLHKEYWGNGYATEALRIIIEFGFNELQLHRIEAGCAVENKASIRVLEKVGMTKEGRKRKVLPLKDGWSDNFEFAILSTD